MKKRQHKTKSRSSWRKRLGRILIGCFILSLLLILLAIGVLLVYPKDKLASIVSEKMSQILQRSVVIERVSINPFGSLEIESVTVGFTEMEGMRENSLFTLERLGVRFKLLPLLRRRFDITGILIDGPKLHLVPVQTTKPVAPTGDTISDTIQIEKHTTLPLTFGLFRLRLKDFRFAMTIPDTSGDTFLAIDGVNLDIANLQFPRDFLSSPHLLRGKVHLFIQDGEFVLQNDTMGLDFITDLDFQLGYYREKKWELALKLGLRPKGYEISSNAQLTMEAEGLGYGENVVLKHTQVLVDSQMVIDVSGEGQNIGPGMTFDLSVGGDKLDLLSLKRSLNSLLPDQWLTSLERMELNGSAVPVTGKITGDLNHVSFDSESSLQNGRLIFRDADFNIQHGSLIVRTQGMWTPDGLYGGYFSGEIGIGSMSFGLNDTTDLLAAGFSLNIESALDSSFLPKQGSLNSRIANILGGTFGIDIHWMREGMRVSGFDDLFVTGNIEADSLLLSALPFSSMLTEGNVRMATDFVMKGIHHVQIGLKVESDSVIYKNTIGRQAIPPIALRTEMNIHSDSLFQNWELSGGTVRLNDILSAQLDGRYCMPDRLFAVGID